MLQCLSVLKFGICQYKAIKLGRGPLQINESTYAMFCTPFPKFWPNPQLPKHQKPHFLLFTDSSSESASCESKTLCFACHLRIFNRSWGSKYSTFPYDKGSILKNTRLKPATQSPKKIRRKF